MEISVTLDQRPVALHTPIDFEGRPIQFSQIRLYLSRFEFYLGDTLIAADQTTAYLIDLENDSTRHLSFSLPDPGRADHVRFLLGIDSAVSTSGAMGQALDPMYGMYWSWQSGYINCKIEGTFTDTKKDFQLHLGGYMTPFAAAQECVLYGSSSRMHLEIDLAPLLSHLQRPDAPLQVMSPGAQALEYSRLISRNIHLMP